MGEISKDIKRVAGYAVLVSVFTFAASWLSFVIFNNRFPNILGIWDRWDSGHYIRIAEYGYLKASYLNHASIPYLPLFPWLIRALTLLTGNSMVSALMISNTSFIFLMVFFYQLVRLDFSTKVAKRTVFFFSIFPTAYFLHGAYSESLFVLAVLVSAYFARKEKWFLAGLFGMAATLTRLNGVAVFPFLLAEYLLAKKFKLKEIKPDILWVFLALLGVLFYLFLNFRVFGNAFEYLLSLNQDYGEYFTVPWYTIARALGRFFILKPADWLIEGFMVVAFWLFSLLLLVKSLERIRFSYGVFAWLNFLLVSCTSTWASMPRFALSFFPIFMVLGLRGQGLIRNSLVTVVFLLLQGLFLSAFILGRWAF